MRKLSKIEANFKFSAQPNLQNRIGYIDKNSFMSIFDPNSGFGTISLNLLIEDFPKLAKITDLYIEDIPIDLILTENEIKASEIRFMVLERFYDRVESLTGYRPGADKLEYCYQQYLNRNKIYDKNRQELENGDYLVNDKNLYQLFYGICGISLYNVSNYNADDLNLPDCTENININSESELKVINKDSKLISLTKIKDPTKYISEKILNKFNEMVLWID